MIERQQDSSFGMGAQVNPIPPFARPAKDGAPASTKAELRSDLPEWYYPHESAFNCGYHGYKAHKGEPPASRYLSDNVSSVGITMNEADAQRFEAISNRFAVGDRIGALEELRNLIQRASDPLDRAGLLYHEVLCLLEERDTVRAEASLKELTAIVEPNFDSESDVDQINLKVSLAVMTRYADAKVLIAKGDENRALAVLKEVVSRYPKQLSTSNFREVKAETYVRLGILLANANRWLEAGEYLKNTTPLDSLKPVYYYYLGQFYFTVRDYARAAESLKKCFTNDMPPKWFAQAHYMLGLAEYHLLNVQAAKREFELSVQKADPNYIRKSNIWGWLEATSKALGEYTESEKYRKLKEET